MNLSQLLMHLIIISLMLVLQCPKNFMSMEVSMTTLIRNVKNLFLMREVVSVVNELCFKRSTDYIGLNMEIIKHVISNIAKPLCYISNKSFLDGTFPDKMKIFNIIQIYKSGNKNIILIIYLFPYYHFIIYLIIMFEKKAIKFSHKKNYLLNDSQYGFRNNRSTSLALKMKKSHPY